MKFPIKIPSRLLYLSKQRNKNVGCRNKTLPPTILPNSTLFWDGHQSLVKLAEHNRGKWYVRWETWKLMEIK